jgi:outer membrane protein OmpA-like peptidoglycan-associated protein
MMKKRKMSLILFAVSFFTGTVFAQDFSGYRQSNYSGVSGGDLNPANIADNRMAVDVTLGAFSMNTSNNYLYFNPHQMPFWYTRTFIANEDKNGTTNGGYSSASAEKYSTGANLFNIVPWSETNDVMNKDTVTPGLFEFDNKKGKSGAFHYNHNVDILNVMVTINPKMAVSLGIKQRTFLNVDHVAPELLQLATNELDVTTLWKTDLSDQLLNVSFNSWNEYNLGFGMVVLDEEEHFVKVGAKLKFLQGLGSAYIYTDDVDYRLFNADTSTNIQGHFNYGYSENMEALIDNPTNASSSDLYDPTTIGTGLVSKLGLGTDIGVVYEWRPNWKEYKYDMDGETNIWRKDKEKYKLKASFAINDIGGMRYAKGGDSRDFTVDIDDVFDLAAFGNVEGLASFNGVIDSLSNTVNSKGQKKVVIDESSTTYYMNLPTHITANVDWQVWNAFYLNAGAFIGVQRNKNGNKVRYPTTFGITPRYDFAWAGVSLPVSYGGVTGFRTGLGLRMGPIIVGTGDLMPFFAPGKDRKISGADIYFAIKVPILRGHPKDADLDKVSDKVDLCIETPGVWEFKGCPDTDGDGIQDTEDKCPTEAGLREFDGCPDRDGDKVIDMNDDCPDTAGLVEFNGCPDTDDDKIIDKNDECPDVAGISAFNGCPDTDGDGIKDSEDLCPNNAGPLENSGCPDTDKDGIFDYLDECITEAGPQENHGCPWPDTDADGILDKDDKCPYNAGPAKNEGCPYVDADGDGVLDKDDECVNVPGLVENKGCPAIVEEEQEILNTAFENLDFETSKAVIKEVSFNSLEELAELMIKKDTWKLKVAGHTDSQGKAQTNLILSKKRAEAVKAFLVQRGVATERIIVQYFGEEKPVADNETAEGRQKNRRVEMEVMFE